MDWSEKQNKVRPQRKYVDEGKNIKKKKHKNWDSHLVVWHLTSLHAALHYSPSTFRIPYSQIKKKNGESCFC